jgi:serine/threonine protein kinase
MNDDPLKSGSPAPAASASPSQSSDPSAPTIASGFDKFSEPTLLSEGHELSGTTLDDRYLLDRPLGRGGMGQVYLARDLQLHSRLVVVKLLLDEAYENEYMVKKFHQEIEALSRLDHPGVIGIIDSGELPDGKPYIVMQYVDGVTLRSIIKPEGMNLDRAADLIRQMGRALSVAHEKGIFHRDLKPENIMLQDLGQGAEQVKIIDFGIAKIKNSRIAPTTATTATAGTISYMAPEQLTAKPVSAATDTYSLGVIAYEMVTGRRPFNPETGFELLEMQRAGVRVRPIDLRPSLPEQAELLILKAISFDSKDRYRTVSDFAEELALALVDEDSTSSRRFDTNSAKPIPGFDNNSLAATISQRNPATNQAAAQSTTPDEIEHGHQAAHLKSPRMMFSLNTTWFKVAIGLFSFAIVSSALFGIIFTSRLSRSAVSVNPVASSAPVQPAAAPHVLTYWLTVQKMRDAKPYGEPFQSSGQEIFENGYKFRLNISTPQAAYLYVFNEGATASGDMSFNIIFPTPLQNAGSPKVDANFTQQTSWNTFAGGPGTEEFWLISSLSPVPELEGAKDAAFQNAGKVTNAATLRSVREFLMKHSEVKPEVTKDRIKQQTVLRGNGDVLVQLLELEHR